MDITLPSDEEFEATLDLLAVTENASRQEVIRRAVLERAQNLSRRQHVTALAEEALSDWADTLDRLRSS